MKENIDFFNKYIVILILLLIIFFLGYGSSTELFQANIYDSPNCCVIRKGREYDHFKYYYSKSQLCDSHYTNIIRTIREGELIDGQPFKMEDCHDNVEKPMFGSCREHGNKSCTEFTSYKDCVKYPSLIWYNKKTCDDTSNPNIHYQYNTNKKPLYIPPPV